MLELTEKINKSGIDKGTDLLGITLSHTELDELKSGNYISLKNKSLSEIGSLFIMASAMATLNAGKRKSSVTFEDLPKANTNSECCSGIPIYSWNSSSQKMHLLLTIVNGMPAIYSCCH